MEALEWYQYLLVIGAGFACGFINTLAGSGSLISLPLLIFLGLPAGVANGTNRVAIMLQNTVGVWRFHKAGVVEWRKAWILAIPAILGAIIGARIAVDLDEQTMRRVIGIIMAIMLVIMIVRPKRWLEGKTELTSKRPGIIQMLVFFAIGVHGGFIQAGVGIFLLVGLVLGAGFDLVRGNAIKLLIILLFTAFALAVFVWHDQVVWSVGLIMAIGNMSGAWIGARAAVKRGAGFVRWVLMAVVVVSATVLLDIPAIITNWLG